MRQKFDLLISELFRHLGLTPPAPSETHHLKLENKGSIHLHYQPNTETLVLFRIIYETETQAWSPDLFRSLLLGNLFADDPIQRGVGLDEQGNIIWWTQTPLPSLTISTLLPLFEELFAASPAST